MFVSECKNMFNHTLGLQTHQAELLFVFSVKLPLKPLASLSNPSLAKPDVAWPALLGPPIPWGHSGVWKSYVLLSEKPAVERC